MPDDDDDGGLAMQPLTKVIPISNTSWGDKDTMLKRPKTAVKVAQCIAEWAEIETMMGMFLATVLGTEFKAGLAMYASLENRTAQRRMILAAAESKLSQEQFDLVQVIFTVSLSPVMKERDRLAHWCWGHCEELPNDLLLQSPETKTEMHFLAVKQGSITEDDVDPSKIFVITESYLAKLATRMRMASSHLTSFMTSISDIVPETERAEFLRQVSNVPQIREGLERQRASHQKTPKARPSVPPKGQRGKR